MPVHETIPYSGTQLNLYQPDSARKLLKEAGFENGTGLPIIPILYNTHEDHKKIAEVVSQMWNKELGVETELLNYEWKIFLQATKNLEHTVARISWVADYADPFSFLELGLSTNGNNHTGYASKSYDKCVEEGRNTMMPQARFDNFLQCEKILMQDMPVIPIYIFALNELRQRSIRGAQPNPLGLYTWKDISLSGVN